MNLRDTIINYHPELAEKYSSEQYKASQDIIKLKLKLKATQEEMSKMLNISIDQYINMESGSTEIPIEEYKNCLLKIE